MRPNGRRYREIENGRYGIVGTQITNVSDFPNLKMSVCWGRAAGGRGAPGVAQRPAGARLTGAHNRTVLLPKRAQPARLVQKLSRA